MYDPDWKVEELYDDAGTPPREEFSRIQEQAEILRAIVSLVILVLLCCLLVLAVAANGDELPTTPEPKAEAQHKRVITWQVVALAAAATADGISTRRLITAYPHAYEGDPCTRILIGRRPTYARMIPIGIAEVAAVALLAHKYPKVRFLAYGLIAAHLAGASGNMHGGF